MRTRLIMEIIMETTTLHMDMGTPTSIAWASDNSPVAAASRKCRANSLTIDQVFDIPIFGNPIHPVFKRASTHIWQLVTLSILVFIIVPFVIVVSRDLLAVSEK